MRLWVLGGFTGEDVQLRFGTWGDGGAACGSPLIRTTATAAFGLQGRELFATSFQSKARFYRYEMVGEDDG